MKSQSMIIFITSVINVLILDPASGWSSFNEQCTTYQEQYNSCDPYAFLFCDTTRNEYICKCSSAEYVWAHQVGRCTLRIGSSCYHGAGVGGVRGSNQIPDCPPNSNCDFRSSTCKCNSNHFPNEDGSFCNKGTKLAERSIIYKGIILVIATRFISSKLF